MTVRVTLVQEENVQEFVQETSEELRELDPEVLALSRSTCLA
jgi:hypothetical protein